ncbi:MAG: WHG domain-containing protein [Myxococcota bacterium]
MAKRKYHHGNLRSELIRAATAILEIDGVQGLTLRRAARDAGVSHAAPAHHFKDKRGLLAAVAAEGFADLLRAMKSHPESATPLDRLRAVGVGYISFALAHPDVFRAMFHPSLVEREDLPELDASAKGTFRHLVEVITDCQSAGLVSKGEPRDLALVAWATVHGASVLAVEDELRGHGLETDPTVLAMAVTTRIFLGLRADT